MTEQEKSMKDGFYKLNPDLVFREDDEGALLFDPETGNVQVLNETGAFICKVLEEKRSFAQVVEALAEEYEMENEAEAEKEVLDFLEKMKESRIIGEVL